VLVTLTNSTTVTATTLNADASIARIVCGTVVEFQPGICVSVQYGTVTASAATTGDATISAVTLANSFVMMLGTYRDQTTYNLIRDEAALTLTSTTNVRLTRGNTTAGDNITMGFVVVELAANVFKSIQKAIVATTAASLTGTATISSVNTANCMLAYGGMRQSVAGTSDVRHFGYVALTDATTLTVTRTLAGTTEITNVAITVIEFQPGLVKSRQSGLNTIASAASQHDDTISSVDTTLAFPTFTGINIGATGLTANTRQYSTGKLNSATVHRADNGGTPSITRSVGYEVIEMAQVGGYNPNIFAQLSAQWQG